MKRGTRYTGRPRGIGKVASYDSVRCRYNKREESRMASSKPLKVVFDYCGIEDSEPVYVEGAIGSITSGGALNMILFSEQTMPGREHAVQAMAEMDDDDEENVRVVVAESDPYMGGVEQGEIYVRRPVRANVLLNKQGVDSLLAWLREMKEQMEERSL